MRLASGDMAAARPGTPTAIDGPFEGSDGTAYAYGTVALMEEGRVGRRAEIAFAPHPGIRLAIRFDPDEALETLDIGGRRRPNLFDILIDGFPVYTDIYDTADFRNPRVRSLVEGAFAAFSLEHRRASKVRSLADALERDPYPGKRG